MLIVGDGHVRFDRTPDASKLAATPRGVRVDCLSEDEFVADGKDDCLLHLLT
jgi:hypothetical protein